MHFKIVQVVKSFIDEMCLIHAMALKRIFIYLYIAIVFNDLFLSNLWWFLKYILKVE